MIENVKVESSQIESLKYEESVERVTVTFRKGAVWSYAPVSPVLWKRWKFAESPGSFFMLEIKNGRGITATKVST